MNIENIEVIEWLQLLLSGTSQLTVLTLDMSLKLQTSTANRTIILGCGPNNIDKENKLGHDPSANCTLRLPAPDSDSCSNVMQVAGLMALMDGEHIGPFNLGNPGEFTMLELAEVRSNGRKRVRKSAIIMLSC